MNCVESFFGRNGLAALGSELGAFVPTLPWGWTNSGQSHPRKTCLAPHPILLVDLHWGSFRQCFFSTISRCRQQRLDTSGAALGRAVLPDPGREKDCRAPAFNKGEKSRQFPGWCGKSPPRSSWEPGAMLSVSLQCKVHPICRTWVIQGSKSVHRQSDLETRGDKNPKLMF